MGLINDINDDADEIRKGAKDAVGSDEESEE